MEHKTWRWRKKGSEKTIVDNGRASLSLERNADEDQERVVPRKCSSNMSDESALVFCDCYAKDELIRKHAKIVEQALAGQKKAGEEAAYFKQELEKTMQQGEVAEQKLANLNTALNECMQEIESLRVEQKVIVESDKERKKLEGRLAEANKRVANLTAENANLMKALLCKEKLVQDLDKGKAELEAEVSMLMERLDSADKENIFLKYEFQVLEKEMEKSHRIELENLKQIKKLEAECQQLQNLVRKRLQGPGVPLPTKRSNLKMGPVEKVCNLEEENKMLKEILALSDGELQSWRVKYSQMASRVAELKAQLNELSEAENSMQLAISSFGLGNFDEVRGCESWANALLAQLEQFRQEKIKNEPEKEKFALVTTGTKRSGNKLQSTSKELVPTSVEKGTSWLDEILRVILEEHRVSGRNFNELLEDIKIAMGCNNMQKSENKSPEISGLLMWESSDSTPPNDDMKDASFAREKIRKRLNFDRSKSENNLEINSPNSHTTLAQLITIQLTVQEENRQVKDKLQSMTKENEALRNQLEEAKKTIESLQREVETLKESKGLIEEQVENQRLINEDLNTQLTVTKAKMNEILHKLSSLEVELEDKSNSCEELEATCLELQLQLETSKLSTKDSPGSDSDQLAKKLRNETFQKLAKQLKALPSPDVTQIQDILNPISTVITIPKSSITDKKSLVVQRSTLRDRMMEEESSNGDKSEKQIVNISDSTAPLPPPPGLKVQSIDQVSSLALVPSKKSGGGFGFITKLFFRRKRGGSKTRATTLQRNTSALMKQRELLVMV